ncbi:hypothetical protein A374_13590 [Fictibacillus macauensis ZFHKF-1]|uniref:Uncharacterized protein n=1 Tax=Fictibacillus macauensis ZFHKF-1 TaxID=1196324 RepID=I8UD46_9BACL|nr:hypothetical protein [Fictibacillus macauensis]EIT84728.1 hypothetical protein A374_13590 [Fictibacillus macauensis ZFHKF-1]
MTIYEYAVMNVVIAFKRKDLNIIDENLMKIAYTVADEFVTKQLDVSLIEDITMDIMPGLIHIEAGCYDWQFDLDGNFTGNGFFANVSVELVHM